MTQSSPEPDDPGISNKWLSPTDSFEGLDREANATITVHVEACAEVGNAGRSGILVQHLANIVCFQPMLAVLPAGRSWAAHEGQFSNTHLVKVPTPISTRQ